ncbi:MAG: hypothetical protein CMA03_01345 [Euryarchaeota archaeon]|nr:hypothetical protein [Euryarchaeota archaeon]
MRFEQKDVELLDINWLKAHEEVHQKKVIELFEMTLRWGGYTKPLLIDRETGTILDGHHRYEVGKKLKLKFIPAIVIDYLEDDRIDVTTWSNSNLKKIEKTDVINMALSGKLFPPKTSKHSLSEYLPPIMIKLDDLK